MSVPPTREGERESPLVAPPTERGVPVRTQEEEEAHILCTTSTTYVGGSEGKEEEE